MAFGQSSSSPFGQFSSSPSGQFSSSPFGQTSTSPFGQTSTSPFGQSLFGLTSNASSNPFAPKPFGSPTANPFGSQTGSSIFGSTSTGVFGQTSSPLATTPTFGASTTPAFGASTMPAFGSGSSFGGSSLFGQKPAFTGFGSTPGQPNPFGSSFQQTQPAFGSSPFGASSQPAFGSTSTPAFGSTATSAFGAASTQAFGATTTSAFGAASTPTFGATTTPSFGSTTTPGFGSTTFGNTGAAFGVSSAPVFGSSPTFGTSTTPAFGSTSTTPAFGATSTPFSFGSAPAFGQSTPAFGSTPFGATSVGAQSSPFGGQSTTPTFSAPGFGQSAFGGQRGGSRVVAYTPTVDTDGTTGAQPAGRLESISSMPAYKEKSHEELRWEDYQQGDKGGPNPAGQPSSGLSFTAPAHASPFGSTGTFGQTPASTFSSTSGSLFGQKPGLFGSSGFGASTPAFSSPFGSSSSSPFASSSTTPSLFGSSTVSAFNPSSTPSLFGTPSTSSFGSATPFGSSAAAGSTPAFGSGLNFGNTQSGGLFQSSPATAQAPALFGQPTPAFSQSTPSFNSNIFGSQMTGFGGSLFSSSTPSLVPSPMPAGFGQPTSSPFQSATPTLTSGAFSFGNFGQAQPASGGFGSISNVFNQGASGQPGTSQTNIVVQPAPITNPFGTLPAMPQMSIGRAGSSMQYGISSMPVSERPTSVKISTILTPRHLSQRRIRLPARKYHPKSDGPRVPFFYEEDEAPITPKADALFIPRENPRTLTIRPIEQWPSRTSTEKNVFSQVPENGSDVENNRPSQDKNDDHSSYKPVPKANGFNDEQFKGADTSYATFSGNRAGEAAIVYEHGADIEALMPKLRHPEYYTEPRIQELAAKERADPGFCLHVKDFVVGRHGYGCIKFEGETDVRRLDLESLVQFNHREVIVYNDESKKPPIGQGLNKPAEVTLLNVKCVDKKTGQQYEGPKVEKYKELLKRKTMEQGAQFVSYDPHKGEWKFKVKHFSHYGIGDGDLDTLTLIANQLEDKVKLFLAL